MECKYCGKEFDNKGLLLAHYRLKECQQEPSDLTIPLSLCPDEVRLLRKGHMVGLKIMGVLVEDGVRFKKNEVSFIR